MEKAERVKYEAKIDEDDLIYAISRESKPVSEATTVNEVEVDISESSCATTSGHCCDDVACDHSLCNVCHHNCESDSEYYFDKNYSPMPSILTQEHITAVEHTARPAPLAAEAPPCSKIEVICKPHDSVDYDVTFQDGERPSKISQDLGNNYLDAEEIAFASIENSSELQDKFLSNDEQTYFVPVSDLAPAKDNEPQPGATRNKTDGLVQNNAISDGENRCQTTAGGNQPQINVCTNSNNESCLNPTAKEFYPTVTNNSNHADGNSGQNQSCRRKEETPDAIISNTNECYANVSIKQSVHAESNNDILTSQTDLAKTDGVDYKRHSRDCTVSRVMQKHETSAVALATSNGDCHDLPPADSSSDENINCIRSLMRLPVDLANDLLIMEGSARQTAILNACSTDDNESCINAVTRAQTKQQEASKPRIKHDCLEQTCTDLDQTQVYIQQQVPYECKITEEIKMSVVRKEVSEVTAKAFLCQSDTRLNPTSAIARKIFALGGVDIKRQCTDHIKRYGLIEGPEVIYTKTTNDKGESVHIMHAIANKHMQSDMTDKQHSAALLYIMTLSLINELALDTAGIELINSLPCRESINALKEAVDAISLSEDGTETNLKLNHIFIMAKDDQETVDIIAALADMKTSAQNKDRVETKDDDDVRDETCQKLQISLTPSDYLEDLYAGDIYRYLRDEILPVDENKARVVLMKADNKFIGNDGLLYNIAQPRNTKRGNSDSVTIQKIVPEKYVGLLLEYMHIATGHSNIDKLFATLKRSFTFERAYTRTLKHIQGCHRCSLLHHQRRPAVAPLKAIKVTGLFEQLSVDLINYSKPSKAGHRNIFAAVDMLTGYLIIAPMKTASAAECLEVFVERVMSRISAPISTHVDRGTSWLAEFQQAMTQLGIKLYRSSSKNCRSNGMVERINGLIHQKLRSFNANHENWHEFLPLVEASINFSVHTRLGLSAYEIVYGSKPRWSIDNLLSNEGNDKIQPRFDNTEKSVFNQLMKRVDNVREDIKLKREKAREVYTTYYNQKQKVVNPTYTVGNIVYLRKCDIRPSKLDLKYSGPYTVNKVYNSEKYGQLLRLVDCNSGAPLQSLMHPDRVKLAVIQKPQNTTTDQMVELKSGPYPSVNFEHLGRIEDDARRVDDGDHSVDDVGRIIPIEKPQGIDNPMVQKSNETQTAETEHQPPINNDASVVSNRRANAKPQRRVATRVVRRTGYGTKVANTVSAKSGTRHKVGRK